MASFRNARRLTCLMKLVSTRPALVGTASPILARAQPSPAARVYSRHRSFATAQGQRKPTITEVLTLNDIPLESFRHILTRNGDMFNRTTPEGYYNCAQQFAEAVRLGADPFAMPIPGKDGFTPEILHEVGCIMRQIPNLSADGFAVSMWSSASAMGYRLSTLSLARHIIKANAFGRGGRFSRVEKRFKTLVATAKDPDALTAEGELLYRQGHYDAALRVLQRALQVGKDDESFEWKAYCELCLGQVYVKLRRYQEAKDIFKSLSESGVPEADIELGQMLRPTDREEAARRLFAVACAGRPDIFAQLSEMSLEQASETKDEKAVREFKKWSDEWSRLANTSTAF